MSTDPNQQPIQAKLTGAGGFRPNQRVMYLALFNDDGTAVLIPTTAADLVMTGYSVPSGSNILATDTVLAAIHKLDARLRAAATPL